MLEEEVRDNMLDFTAAAFVSVLHLAQSHHSIFHNYQIVEPLSSGIKSKGMWDGYFGALKCEDAIANARLDPGVCGPEHQSACGNVSLSNTCCDKQPVF